MNIISSFLKEKDHTVLQFVKYSLCGITATVVDMVTFFIVAWLIFPALTESDLPVRIFGLTVKSIPESVRTLNFCIDSVIAFIFSNLTAYILNVQFVFRAGKHSRSKEVLLFYLVSAASVGIGVLLGAVLIRILGISTTLSYVAKVVSTTLINYAARKFIIFHG